MQRRNKTETIEDDQTQIKKEESKSQSSQQMVPGERKIIRIKRKWVGEENKENVVQNQQNLKNDALKTAQESSKTKLVQEASETQFTEDSSLIPRG